MNKPNQRPRRKQQVRRKTTNLTIQSQLVGKLGTQGYGRLLDLLGAITKRAA